MTDSISSNVRAIAWLDAIIPKAREWWGMGYADVNQLKAIRELLSAPASEPRAEVIECQDSDGCNQKEACVDWCRQRRHYQQPDPSSNTLSAGARGNTDPVAGRAKPQGEPALPDTLAGSFVGTEQPSRAGRPPKPSDNPHVVTEYQRGFDDGFRRAIDGGIQPTPPQLAAEFNRGYEKGVAAARNSMHGFVGSTGPTKPAVTGDADAAR